jgi:hypothetical protein
MGTGVVDRIKYVKFPLATLLSHDVDCIENCNPTIILIIIIMTELLGVWT